MSLNISDINQLYGGNSSQISSLADRAKRTQNSSSAMTKGIDKSSKLYKTSQEFEAIFIKQMLSTMRKTINKSGLLDGGHAEEIFEDMLYDNYAQKMAETADFGLAETLYRQLSGLDRVAEAVPPASQIDILG